MPTEQETKDAEAKAAAEKADNDAAETALKEIDALAEKGESITDDGFVKVKKSQIHKIASDRNNYKNIGLDKKKKEAEDRKLEEEKNKGGQGGNNQQGIDEKKSQEIAETSATKILRAANEKTAKRLFFKSHPEYVEEKAWGELLTSLTFKGGEVTTEEILDRMEAAVLEHKRQTGKLDEYIKEQNERARSEGRVEGRLDDVRGGGVPGGDKNEAGKGTGLSEKGKEMAERMHVDADKAGKIDPKKDNVITKI